VSRTKPTNITASNRAKLLNLSRTTGQSFQELVQYFAMSRFLYRLAVSQMSSCFVLKGALLLHARKVDQARSTLDIDLLGYISNSPDQVAETIKQIMQQDVDPDGLEFLYDTIEVSEISRDAGYVGCRINFKALLGTMRIPMQVDIGFGDRLVPDPELIPTPSLLGYPSAQLMGYALETSVAEKVHVMFQRELLNSRIKDYYDIWLLIRQDVLNTDSLVKALIGTFEQRHATLTLESPVLTQELGNDEGKQKQWKAFCRKRSIENAPQNFSCIAGEVVTFIKPIIERAMSE